MGLNEEAKVNYLFLIESEKNIKAITNLYLILIYKKTQLSDRSAFLFLLIDIFTPLTFVDFTQSSTSHISYSLFLSAQQKMPKYLSFLTCNK